MFLRSFHTYSHIFVLLLHQFYRWSESASSSRHRRSSLRLCMKYFCVSPFMYACMHACVYSVEFIDCDTMVCVQCELHWANSCLSNTMRRIVFIIGLCIHLLRSFGRSVGLLDSDDIIHIYINLEQKKNYTFQIHFKSFLFKCYCWPHHLRHVIFSHDTRYLVWRG